MDAAANPQSFSVFGCVWLKLGIRVCRPRDDGAVDEGGRFACDRFKGLAKEPMSPCEAFQKTQKSYQSLYGLSSTNALTLARV